LHSKLEKGKGGEGWNRRRSIYWGCGKLGEWEKSVGTQFQERSSVDKLGFFRRPALKWYLRELMANNRKGQLEKNIQKSKVEAQSKNLGKKKERDRKGEILQLMGQKGQRVRGFTQGTIFLKRSGTGVNLGQLRSSRKRVKEEPIS